MAASVVGSADGLRRTTGLANVADDYTLGFWVEIGAIPTAPDYSTLFVLVDDVGVYVDWIGAFWNDLGLSLDISGTAPVGAALPFGVGDKVYITYTRQGTTHRLYVNNTLFATVTRDVSAYTIGQLWLGHDSFSTGDQAFSYFVEYARAITSATDRLAQMGATDAALATPFTFTPLTSDFLDTTGNGHTWTEVGSTPFVASPAIPGNTSPYTATTIASLPFSTTQSAVFQGVTYTLWYKYTAIAGDNEIGLWGYGNFSSYRPVTTILSPDEVTSFITAAGTERPFQFPVTEGVTYWYQFNKGAGNPDPAVLTVESYRFTDVPMIDIPDGAIGVNDEKSGFPAAFVSRTVDYETYRFVQGIANGDHGAQLEDGTLALDNGNRAGIPPNGQIIIYSDSRLTSVLATIARTLNSGSMTSNRVDAFYFLMVGTASPTVQKFTPTGTLLQTINPTGGFFNTMCVSPDDTILYYTNLSSAVIRRWDLVGNVAMSDLVTLPALPNQTEMLCLADGSIIVLVSSLFRVLRYSPAGSLLNTYQFPISISTFAGNRLAHDNDPGFFWMRDHVDTAFNKFFLIEAATGVMTELRHASFLSGVYGETTADATPTPLARFGVAESCPMWVIPGDVPPPPEPPVAEALNLACPAGLFTLTGSNFTEDTEVTVTKDGDPVTPVTIESVSPTTITFTLPAGTTDTGGTYCVTVSDDGGESEVCAALSCPGGEEGCPPDWSIGDPSIGACAPDWSV